MNTHPMWCCDRCNFAQYHPMNYCPKCPGRLYRREIPHPVGSFAFEEQRITYLKQHNIQYECEYPEVSTEEFNKNRLIRLRERLEEAKQSGNIKRIQIWEDLIKEITNATD